jgi:hypothetical protein
MKTTLTEMLGILEMSSDGVVAVWWVSIPLAIFFFLSMANLIRRRSKLQPVTIVLCVVLVASALLFSAMAVLIAANTSSPTAVEDAVMPGRVLGVLGLATIIAIGSCVYMSEDQRAAATSTALFGGWLVFWVYFVAAMSVSGSWL